MILDDVLKMGGIEDEDLLEAAASAFRGRGRERGRRRLIKDGNAETFTAEHEPDDAEFPVFEAAELRMRAGVEIDEGAGGDEVFASAFAAGKSERDIRDLFRERVHRAIHPDDLLVGVGEHRAGRFGFFAAEPSGRGGVEGFMMYD